MTPPQNVWLASFYLRLGALPDSLLAQHQNSKMHPPQFMVYAAYHNGRHSQARTTTDSNSGESATGLLPHGRGRHAGTLHLVHHDKPFPQAPSTPRNPLSTFALAAIQYRDESSRAVAALTASNRLAASPARWHDRACAGATRSAVSSAPSRFPKWAPNQARQCC